MKQYKSYMDRQEISPAVHENLLNLEPPKDRSGPSWVRYGALAACAALLIGVGAWRLGDGRWGCGMQRVEGTSRKSQRPGM